jgi:uncharacterized DUF497 family protein
MSKNLSAIGESVDFEWDAEKEARNEQKHGVSFHEAATIFGDPLAITFENPDHSTDEHRYLTFGTSRFGQLLVVPYGSFRKHKNNQRSAYDQARKEHL